MCILFSQNMECSQKSEYNVFMDDEIIFDSVIIHSIKMKTEEWKDGLSIFL